jgi:hypothetical protein
MPLSDEDAVAVLAALHDSLREAGYADAADQISRVANEPLDFDELDDGRDEEAVAREVAEPHDDEETGEFEDARPLEDPTPVQRVSAAVKIVDLMVIEPLQIEAALPSMWLRAGLDVSELLVGQGTSATLLPFQPSVDSVLALDAWNSVLTDLRDLLENGEANYR